MGSVVSPRLDSPGLVVANAVTLLLLGAVLVVAMRRRRRGAGPTFWGWMCILVHVSIAGIYLPVGPVAWLIAHRRPGAGPA